MSDKELFTNECSLVIEESLPLNNGGVYIRKYERGIILGRGGFATCYAFKNLDNNKVYAAKIVDKKILSNEKTKKKLLTEIKIHQSLRHPNIVILKYRFEDPNYVYIILELCRNKTLLELLEQKKYFNDNEVRYYMKQLISALKFLHNKYIIHRDLKLGNLFLDSKMVLKLGDFGLATQLSDRNDRRKTICGTPNYIAPEILSNSNMGYGVEADIWSLGCVLFTLICGRPPFESYDIKSTYKRIRNNFYCFPEDITISQISKDIIQFVLQTLPHLRPSLDDIINHKYFSTQNSSIYSEQNEIPTPFSICTDTENMTSSTSPQQIQSKDNGEDEMISNQLNKNISINSSDMKDFLDSPTKLTKLDILHDTINNTLDNYYINTCNRMLINKSNFHSPSNNNFYIATFTDYTWKYGVGYYFYNGSIGLYFNDNTKIICDRHHHYFEYHEKKKHIKMELNGYITESSDLKKKTTLLNRFITFFIKSTKNKQRIINFNRNHKFNEDDHNLIYVKKIVKTPKAMIWQLSNKSVQISFASHQDMIYFDNFKLFTYIDVNGYVKSGIVENIAKYNDSELMLLLNYTRDIIQNI